MSVGGNPSPTSPPGDSSIFGDEFAGQRVPDERYTLSSADIGPFVNLFSPWNRALRRQGLIVDSAYPDRLPGDHREDSPTYYVQFIDRVFPLPRVVNTTQPGRDWCAMIPLKVHCQSCHSLVPLWTPHTPAHMDFIIDSKRGWNCPECEFRHMWAHWLICKWAMISRQHNIPRMFQNSVAPSAHLELTYPPIHMINTNTYMWGTSWWDGPNELAHQKLQIRLNFLDKFMPRPQPLHTSAGMRIVEL